MRSTFAVEMKSPAYTILAALLLAAFANADWTTEKLGETTSRKLTINDQMVYRYGIGPGLIKPEKTSRNHRFYWNGRLALDLNEHDGQEDLYFGTDCTTHPEAGVETNTWDYNKDGIIDAVRLGKVTDDNMLFFGRYRDGVFALAPTEGSFTDLWTHLKNNDSEQGGARHPATAPESKPEGKESPKPESAVRP